PIRLTTNRRSSPEGTPGVRRIEMLQRFAPAIARDSRRSWRLGDHRFVTFTHQECAHGHERLETAFRIEQPVGSRYAQEAEPVAEPNRLAPGVLKQVLTIVFARNYPQHGRLRPTIAEEPLQGSLARPVDDAANIGELAPRDLLDEPTGIADRKNVQLRR